MLNIKINLFILLLFLKKLGNILHFFSNWNIDFQYRDNSQEGNKLSLPILEHYSHYFLYRHYYYFE